MVELIFPMLCNPSLHLFYELIKHKLKEMNIETDGFNISKLMNYVKSKEKCQVSDYEIISLLNENEINTVAYQ